MGSAKRPRPRRLGEKLLSIRNHFGYSLSQMAEKLSDEKVSVVRSEISRFEQNKREPNLLILLRYARLMGVLVESLIDDEMDLSS